MEERNLILHKFIPKLVTNLTGFKPNDENFKICLDFVWSNIKHHKFLSVNSHEIKRDIEGICQKFKVNHFHDEEKIIRKLFEQSLSHEISVNHSQKESMYSIINLLINLAYDPINKLKDKKRRGLPIFIKQQKVEQEENIVFKQNFIDSLLQENFMVSKNDTDSDLSEWTESEDEEVRNSTEHSDCEVINEPKLLSKLRPPQKPNVYTNIKLENTLKWLKNNVQNSWWNIGNETTTSITSTHKAANFHTEWQRHLTRKSLGFIKPQPVSLLTEYCLLREILWMFLNPVDCKFFKITADGIAARPNVCLHSTTVESLQIFLKNFLRPMNIMFNLRSAIQKSMKDSRLNHTMENYYGIIQQFLDEIIEFFIEQEELLKKQENIFTIMTLNHKMKPHSRMLELLWNIHATCILDVDNPSHIRSLYLIANLNHHVNHSASKEKKNLSITFLLTCLKTYFQILEIWWTEARLHDSKMEFIVEKILIEDTEVIQPRLIAKNQQKAFYVNDKVSSKIIQDPLISSLMYFSVEASYTLEVISKLDRIHEMKQIRDDSKSLYDEFMESISDEIKNLASEPILETETEDSTKISNNQKLFIDIGNEMLSENEDIMFLIFNSTFENLETDQKIAGYNPIKLYEKLNMSTNSLLLPLENSIVSLLKKLLAKKIAIAERFVMNIYFNEFQIEHYLQDIRKVYFLESNELINLFNFNLFQQMENGTKWANSYLLTVLFNETISRDTNLFTVHVNKILGHQTVLEAIDELTIYLNVNNNFDNIFTSSCISKYNDVFRLLLKIKWAQRILNCLTFPDFYKHRFPYAKITMLDLVIKRLALTRFSMQQSITTVHNHIMATLQSLGNHFDENIRKTHKITDLIVYHTSFVKNFHAKALLGDESTKIRGIIIEMIKLAKVVVNEWQNIILFYELDSSGKAIDDSLSLTALNVNTIEIEKAFKACEKQLKDLFYY